MIVAGRPFTVPVEVEAGRENDVYVSAWLINRRGAVMFPRAARRERNHFDFDFPGIDVSHAIREGEDEDGEEGRSPIEHGALQLVTAAVEKKAVAEGRPVSPRRAMAKRTLIVTAARG
jgi:hypothetical protein